MSSVAALWDEFLEEDPLGDPIGERSISGGGSPAGGQPFLQGILDANARIMVEAAFGADPKGNPDLWNFYDITTDVMQANNGMVNISPMGRSDETSQAQPAGCTFQLLNTSGDYSKGPASRYFPNVRRNTPIRVRLYINGTWYTRFQGYANGFVPSWDGTANLATVSVSASGVLRRLNQGKNPLRSPLERVISHANPAPVAYWPLEDGKNSTQAESAVNGVAAMSMSGAVKFFNSAGPAGSDSLPSFSGGSLTGAMPTGAYIDSWRVEFALKYDSAIGTVSSSEILDINTNGGSIAQWVILANSASGGQGIQVERVFTGGTSTSVTASNFGVDDGNWHWVRLDVETSGSDIAWFLWVDGNVVVNGLVPGGVNAPPVSVVINSPKDTTIAPNLGHLVFWEPALVSVDTRSAYAGLSGETTTARMARLCAENGVIYNQIGPGSTTTMGPQSVNTLINLLRECETTEDGVLIDGQSAGLTFVTRAARYDIPASLSVDASSYQLGGTLSPVDDDQRNRNLIKVDRSGGSSATFEDDTDSLGTNNIGTYDSSVTVNYADDTGLLNRAAWEVHKGTVDDPYRYPSLSLDLAATSALVPAWLVTQLLARVDVLNASSVATQHPVGTISLLLEGYSESLSPFVWSLSLNCSPFQPWKVAVIEATDDTKWRVDSGGSTLVANASVGDTSFQVAVSDGYLWSTSAGDYPRNISVNGALVTVTAVSGSSSPQTFTVNALPYPLAAGWAVSLYRPPTIAL